MISTRTLKSKLIDYKSKKEKARNERAFSKRIRRLPTFPHQKGAVSWAPTGLTTVFGMGTGVTLPTKSPEN